MIYNTKFQANMKEKYTTGIISCYKDIAFSWDTCNKECRKSDQATAVLSYIPVERQACPKESWYHMTITLGQKSRWITFTRENKARSKWG